MIAAPAVAPFSAAPPDIVPAKASPDTDPGAWGIAGGIAFALHAAAIAAIAIAVVPAEKTVPEPVVLVDLPPEAGPVTPSVQPATPRTPQAQPQVPQPQAAVPPVDIPPVRTPITRDAVTLPPPPVQSARQVQTPAAVSPAPVTAPPTLRSGAGAGTSDLPGTDPKSQKLEADYKSLVGAHIRRNRFSPPQSRKAGISGDVKLRFVVHRDGSLTDVAVAASSGQAVLDGEAAAFLRQISPVPSFPRDLRKAEIPLTITLKFQVESK